MEKIDTLKRMTNKLVPCPFRESTQKKYWYVCRKWFVKNPFTGLKNLNEEVPIGYCVSCSIISSVNQKNTTEKTSP